MSCTTRRVNLFSDTLFVPEYLSHCDRRCPNFQFRLQNEMSSAHGYAESLSEYSEKGKLNLQHIPDCPLAILQKARYLADIIRDSEHVVVHTGAGISTCAGISDFRGPQGVWTTAKRPSKRPRRGVPFHRAIPTITHMALLALYKAHYIHYIVSQNVDALHLRSGFPREALSELHGNIFVEYCPSCDTEHLREKPVRTVGLKTTGNRCSCGADLYDRALDWEDPLPEKDFELSKEHAEKADLNIVLGTSCQMEPARLIPFRGKRGKAAVVLVNLSETPFDDRFGFRIRAKCDDVLSVIVKALGLRLDVFERRVCARFQVHWIDRDVAKYSLWHRDGGTVDGIQVIRYGDVEGSGEGFEASVEGVVDAVVEFHDGRSQTLCLDKHDVQLVVDRKDWNDEILRLEGYLVRKARLYEGEIKQSEFFVCGRRRGWGICSVCRSEVWCGNGKRDSHLRDCLRRRL